MKQFISVDWKISQCRQELEKLRDLLAKQDTLLERKHIMPLFRSSHHLAGFLGSYFYPLIHRDRIAYEYDLFGDFSCDLVVGDSAKSAYNFVEFEEAAPNSVFRRQGKKATREWSAKFDHGYSQIIDWFGKLRDTEKSDDFEARFGARSIAFMGTLVVGRDKFFQAGERQRFNYRREYVIVDSHRVHCITYDELFSDLSTRLQEFTPTPPTPSATNLGS